MKLNFNWPVCSVVYLALAVMFSSHLSLSFFPFLFSMHTDGISIDIATIYIIYNWYDHIEACRIIFMLANKVFYMQHGLKGVETNSSILKCIYMNYIFIYQF